MAARLLPPSASPMEARLEQAMARFEDVREVPVDTLWDPARCPAPLLPWLAWALGVRWWDDAWSTPTQRRAIAASIDLRRIEGTEAALHTALRAVGAVYEIVAYPDLPAHHTARIDVWNTPQITTPVDAVNELLDAVGRLSVEYTVRANSAAFGTVPVAIAATAVTVAVIGGGA